MPFPILTPPWCRWNSENPPPFTIWLNLLYTVAGGFVAANLYYSHPILHVLADDFHTTQGGVANIPTLALAGDACGLLFILPLADFFPRRKFTLFLLSLCMLFWIGLCITTNLTVFLVLTYLSSLFNGVTQIMLPLVAELSPPEKRAFNISIVATGPTLAILLARILSGIVANYTSWRNIYWLALGLQCMVLVLLWCFMPDYPPTNQKTKKEVFRDYPKILWSVLTIFVGSPTLVQNSFTSFLTSFTVSSFWTTLTFLLSGPPYEYSTSLIGLFGLIGACTLVLGPLYGKYIIQPLKVPLFSAIIGKSVSLTGIVIGTFVGLHNVAGPVLQALLLDAGLMILQISNRIAIHDVAPKARNRVNTAFITMLYLGLFTGTKAGNEVYEKYGGWIASGCLSIGIILASYVVICARGPHEQGWVGWRGGWRQSSCLKEDEESSGETERTKEERNSSVQQTETLEK